MKAKAADNLSGRQSPWSPLRQYLFRSLWIAAVVSNVGTWDSILMGRSLRDSQIRERFGVTVVAIIRTSGKVLINPSPETVLQHGDKLRVFGLIEQIKTFAAAAGK